VETGGTTNGLEKMILKNRLVYLPVNSGWHKRNISIRKATREIESYVYSSFLCRFQLLQLGASDGAIETHTPELGGLLWLEPLITAVVYFIYRLRKSFAVRSVPIVRLQWLD